MVKFPVAVEELAPWGFKTKFAIGSFLGGKWHRSGARSFLVDSENGLVLPIGLLAMEERAEKENCEKSFHGEDDGAVITQKRVLVKENALPFCKGRAGEFRVRLPVDIVEDEHGGDHRDTTNLGHLRRLECDGFRHGKLRWSLKWIDEVENHSDEDNHEEADTHAVEECDFGSKPHAVVAECWSYEPFNRSVENDVHDDAKPAEVAWCAWSKESEEEHSENAGADEALELLYDREDAAKRRIAEEGGDDASDEHEQQGEAFACVDQLVLRRVFLELLENVHCCDSCSRVQHGCQ